LGSLLKVQPKVGPTLGSEPKVQPKVGSTLGSLPKVEPTQTQKVVPGVILAQGQDRAQGQVPTLGWG